MQLKKYTLCALLLLPTYAEAANYALDIINIDDVGTNNRIKYAYPGIEYKVRIFAHGGTYPFIWELTASTTCGASIDSASGVITWASPVVGDNGCTVDVKVTDSEANTDTESYTVAVTDSTDRFIFMDADNSAGGRDGSFSNPYRDFDDFWAAGGQGNKILYMYTGTYDFSGITGVDGRSQGAYRITYSPDSSHPIAMLAYPGESPEWSGTRGWNGTNTGKHFYGGGDDIYFEGITFKNQYSYSFELNVTNYAVWHDCTFQDMATGSVYINDASISWGSSSGTIKIGIGGCTFNGGTTGDYIVGIKNYDVSYQVLENNTFANHTDMAVSWKDNTDYSVARVNTFSSNDNGIGIAGYGDGGCVGNEIAFNLFDDNDADMGDIYLNNSGTIGATYIYRNTIIGNPTFRLLDSASDGPIYLDDNVIVNSLAESSGAETDYTYYREQCEFINSDNVYTSKCVFSGNVKGAPADNIIDASGNLLGTYRDTYLGVAGWETAETAETAESFSVQFGSFF